jgi:tetratricopeptide (TPR) repeat protein
MADDLSPTRKRLFGAILALLVLLLPLLVLETAVRLSGIRVSDDPYLQLGKLQPVFAKQKSEGRQYYQVISKSLYRERHNRFPVRKDPDTFRVFILGASASAGWPHPSQETFSAYLNEALVRAYPQHHIEVINVSAHSYPAYRVRLILQDVLQFEPDLLIVWTGNNEYVEQRVYREHWFDPLVDVANRSAVFRILRGSHWAATIFPENTLPGGYMHKNEAAWGLKRHPLELRKNPEQFERLKEHYAYSIESMVSSARNKGIPMILLTVPVNLRDWRPNISYQPLKGDQLTRWQEHYNRGRAALLRGDADTAISELRLAASLGPLHGETYFHLAHALEAKERFAEALENFDRARDLDYNPSRAISAFNTIIRKVASQYDGVELVDADAAFRSASAPRAPGFDLFLDYVHPTQRGNLLIAKIVFDTIVKDKLLTGTPAAEGFSHEPKPYQCGQEERLHLRPGRCPSAATFYDDATDFSMQVMLLHLFTLMNQPEIIAARLTSLSETPGAIDSLSPAYASFVKDAMGVYPPLVALKRRKLLGEPVKSELTDAQENLRKFELKYVED